MHKARNNRLLALAIGAAALAFVGLILFSFLSLELENINDRQLAAHESDLKLHELRSTALRYDEILSMSARMYTATGNPDWLERYERYAGLLDEVLNELAGLAAEDPEILADTELTMRANRHLVGMEREAFRLVSENRRREALETLSGAEYESMKTLFVEGMSRMVDRLRDMVVERFRVRRSEMLIESAGAALVAVLLIAAVWIIFMRYRGQSARRATAERGLGETQALLQSLIDSTPDLIFFKDEQGVYIGCNKAFTEFLGRPAGSITGHTDFDIFEDRSVAEFFREQDRIMLESGQSRRNEEWVTYPDGSRRLLDTLKSPYFSDSGELLGLIGVSRDVTSRHESRAELQAAKEKAEAASRAKSRFLANMGHELRTPLIPIISMVDLLLESDLPEDKREHLRMVAESSGRLLNLINDLLEYSRLEKGEAELNLQPASPERVVKSVIEAVSSSAAGKGLKIGGETAPDAPAAFMGDEVKLRRLLVILAENAVKFTEKGRIDVSARAGETSTGEPAVVFEVEDTGIGLSPEQVENLFENFSQADDSASRRYGGVGLGLSMARRLAEIMDAELSVESTRGRGSTFRLAVAVKEAG